MAQTTVFEDIKKRNRAMTLTVNIVTLVFLTIWAILVLFPFVYMILTSFKPTAEYDSEIIPRLLINNPTLDNYQKAISEYKLLDYFFNTLIFSLITTLAMVIVSVLAAFAFARLEFKGKNLAFTLLLSLMMIPTELVIITNYHTIVELGWRNTMLGLVLPSITSVFYIYLLRENFMQVSDDIYFAAKVDGCSDFKYMCRVLIPINRPTIISIIILKLIECWNAFVWPRLITTDKKLYLVSNGIEAIKESGVGRANIPAMMAAVVIVSIPLIIIYLIFHRQIMEGVSKSGTKG